MHFLSLALGLINTAGVARLAAMLTPPGNRRQAAGVLASLAFALFPLSYRNMAWAAAIGHAAVTSATLLAVAAASRFVATGRRRWLILSLALPLLAPLAAETGVVAGFIVAGVIGLRALPVIDRRTWSVIIPGAAVSVLTGLGMAAFAGNQLRTPTGLTLFENGAFLIQGLVYPAAPVVRWLTAASVPAVPAAVTIGLILPLAAGLVLWRSAQFRLFASGLVWFALASGVPWYSLTLDYMVNSQHLHYFGSVGAALVWAAIFTGGLFQARRALRRLSASLALALFAGSVLVISHAFQLFGLALDPLQTLARAAEAHPATRILAVNLPGWINWPQGYFAIGKEGAIVLSDECPAQLFLDYNSRSAAQIEAVTVSDLQNKAPYYVGLHGTPMAVNGLADSIRAASAVYALEYQPERILLRDLGGVTHRETTSPGPVARFENGLRLLAADFLFEPGQVRLSLDWHLAGAPSDYNFFVHLFDCQGNVLGLADGPALGRLYPLQQWQTGETVHDNRYFPLEQPAPGCYLVEAGLFDLTTGDRVAVFDAVGNEYPNRAVTLSYP